MIKYEPSPADKAPLPPSYVSEARYLKYREADAAKPYAKYFRTTTRPVRDEIVYALTAGMSPTEYGYPLTDAVDRLAAPGYDNLETGWTKLENGVIFVAVHTPMPGVTPEMWDWWFGWHGSETARYKLWYPDAHQFSAVGENRSHNRELTDRQRYIDNVSYVDEYIGGVLQPLAIRFLDPRKLGFPDIPGTTHICARVSLSSLPVAFGWLIHQVRATADGAEMRSRFFLNTPATLALPRRALPPTTAARFLTTQPGRLLAKAAAKPAVNHLMPATLGADMVHHCAAEMNHLAGFLPQLHEEFVGSP